jgi:hydroxyethylthiazole kinase-like uncharacterized protein yjeF
VTDRPILTAGEMRAAEAAAIAAGAPAETLMERAGTAAAEAIRRYAGHAPALILCGPGNNGGDGYVIALRLAEAGVPVQVAALAEPKTPAARAARGRWAGAVASLEGAQPASVLVDALFGTGLTRGLDEAVSGCLAELAAEAQVRVAIDLPSGVATDDGTILSPVPDFDLTITFGALKPSHLLQPAARHMGRLVVADIGVEAASALHEVGRPHLRAPSPDDHKYSRGYIAIVAGEMAGAAALCASAALRAGAGYVRLIAHAPLANVPNAVVQGGSLDDPRIDALLIGPGLGRGPDAAALLERAIATGKPLILDADALHILPDLAALPETPILTPHAGEFAKLLADRSGSKVDQARRAAARHRAVIVYKGSDTVIAAPDGRAAILPPSPAWLASAGTGDVLAGIAAAMRASGLDPFDAACAAAWLHRRAAQLAGPALIADDLIAALPAAVAECL